MKETELIKVTIVHKSDGISRSLCGVERDGLNTTVFKSVVTCPDCRRFMRQDAIKTDYTHRLGPVVVSNGLGSRIYGAYALKPNGSLKRLASIPQYEDPMNVQFAIEDYRGKTIWKNTKK